MGRLTDSAEFITDSRLVKEGRSLCILGGFEELGVGKIDVSCELIRRQSFRFNDCRNVVGRAKGLGGFMSTLSVAKGAVVSLFSNFLRCWADALDLLRP